MSRVINGWACIGDRNDIPTVEISGSNLDLVTAEYMILVPDEDGVSIATMQPPEGDFARECGWICEIANGDPTLSKSIDFVGGTPGEMSMEIFIHPPATKLTLPPAHAQRFVWMPQSGWAPLVPGTLV